MNKINKNTIMTNERKLLVMETFFSLKTRSVKKVAEIVGTQCWATNNVITKYYENGGLIIESKMNYER